MKTFHMYGPILCKIEALTDQNCGNLSKNCLKSKYLILGGDDQGDLEMRVSFVSLLIWKKLSKLRIKRNRLKVLTWIDRHAYHQMYSINEGHVNTTIHASHGSHESSGK